MNIVTLGAGRGGESGAESLVSGKNDISVTDTHPQGLRQLQDRLDLRGVVGNGIQPSVLAASGTRDADRLIGGTAADDTKLVVCQVGLRLVRELQGPYEVKLIEMDRTRCEYLATELGSSRLVLNGDCTDEALLEDENVGDMDLFAALSSADEDNIMSCLLAKRMGAKRVLALINRKAYADRVQGGEIDIARSPSNTVIGELLA